MVTTPYRTLASQPPEAFVRAALRLIEEELRRLALRALGDWERVGVIEPSLFGAIAHLQRPSFGSWNGLLQGLRNARRNALRGGRAVPADTLDAILRALEVTLSADVVARLDGVAKLSRVSLRRANRSRLYELAIAVRNRVAHDDPTDASWWSEVQAGLAVVVEYLEANPVELTGEEPAPWFRGGAAFTGMTQTFEVTYAGDPKPDSTQSQRVLHAMQLLLGETDTKDVELKTLLARLAPDESKGVVLGDFLVGKPVGKGGFGTVHVGRQLSTGRKVAIKILHDGLDEDAALRFQREAAYLSQFSHPAIVAVLAYGEDTWTAPRHMASSDEEWFVRFTKGAPIKVYMALEWIDGRTLDEVFTSERPALPTIIDWFHQAAEALAAVHALGLIHRDVKPANLMVTPGNRLVLMDFGIARTHHHDRTQLTMTGTSLGTPAYMAPEQIALRDAEADVGPAADLYGLCATFYELLTHRRLYDHGRDTEDRVSQRKLDGDAPERPRTADRTIPWQLETLVLGGLLRETRDRPVSMRALADDLAAVSADRPIEYRRPSVGRRLQLGYRRNRRAVWIALLFIAAATAGVVVYIVNLRDEQQRTAVARAQADDQLTKLFAEQGRQRLMEGKRVDALLYLQEAYRRSPKPGGEITSSLADAMQIVDAQERVIHTGKRITSATAFSRDGTRFAIAGEMDGIEVWNLLDGTHMHAVNTDKAAAMLIRFSDDGHLVAVVKGERALVFDARGAKIREITDVVSEGSRGAVDGSLSDDARALATRVDEGPLIIVDPITGAERITIEGARGVNSVSFGSGDLIAVVGPGEVDGISTSTASVWNLATGKKMSRFVDHADADSATTMSVGGGPRMIKSGGEVFDTVHFTASGAVITTDGERRVKKWDAATGQLLDRVSESDDHTTMPELVATDDRAVVVASSGLARVDGGIHPFVVPARGSIESVALHKTHVAVGHSSGEVTLHDVWTGNEMFVYQAAAASIASVTFTRDGKSLIVADTSGDIRVWRVTETRKLQTFYAEHLGSTAAVVGVAKWLVGVYYNGVAIWDVDAAAPPRIVRVEQTLHGGLKAFVAGDKVLFHDERYIGLVDVAAANLVFEKETTISKVASDGTHVVAQLYPDRQLVMWNLAGEQVWTATVAKPSETARWGTTLLLSNVRITYFDGETLHRWSTQGVAEPARKISGDLIALASGLERAVVDRDGTRWVVELEGAGERKLPVADGKITFAADGQTLFVHRAFGAVEVWDAATATRRLTLSARVVGDYVSFELLGTDRIVGTVEIADNVWGGAIWSAHDGAALGPFPVTQGQVFGDTRFVTREMSGFTIWDLGFEKRSITEIDALVRDRIPWRLVDGRIVATTP